MIEISDKGYELVCDFKAAVMGAHGECATIDDVRYQDKTQLALEKYIAELELMVERLVELGDVINGDKDSVWTLQTIKECWTEDVTKWKEAHQ